jgi:membrane fusion protein (multidrug efflux system)
MRPLETKSHSARRAAVATFALTAFAGCHHAESVALPPTPAILTIAVQAQPEPALSRRGAVTTGARLRLGFNQPGVLASVNVKTGDVIRKGQLLAQLKDGGASASLQAAQANRARAQRDFGTARMLAGSGSLPVQQRDDAQSLLQVANANTSLAAELLADRRLLSPITGSVLQRLAEPGEAVAPGMPVLVVDDAYRLVVKVGVNERELPRVTPGQPAKLAVDGDPNPAPAVVSSVAPAPLGDGLYTVEVTPTDDHIRAFRAGTLLTVSFEELATAASIRIPLDALVYRQGKTWVFVVVPATGPSSDATVQIREVVLDRTHSKDVGVKSGLALGERIVREGADFLQDGQAVRVLD